MAKTMKDEEKTITINRLDRGLVTLYVLGKSLVMNRMSKKARETLLLPRPTQNRAAREQVLKHDPPAEFRESIYRCRDENAPTLVHVPNGAFKKAMAQAALDMPGATKAEIGRLVKVIDATVHVYGKPYLYMDTVRMAGINRTPDIRTRALFKEWACKITIQYIRSKIREQDIVNLMDAAGTITGIGDGRTEKGTFNNGEWELVSGDNEQWLALVRKYGRKAQQAAMDTPEASDMDTEELLAWFGIEIIRRERDHKSVKAPVGVVLAAEASNGKQRKQRPSKQKEMGE